ALAVPDASQRAVPLREDAGGASLVTDCDRLAAHADDPQRPPGLRGIELMAIDGQRAAAACADAIRLHPEVARFHFQAGRVAVRQKDYASARALFEAAAGKGSAAGMTGLGYLYRDGLGVARNDAEARKWLQK